MALARSVFLLPPSHLPCSALKHWFAMGAMDNFRRPACLRAAFHHTHTHLPPLPLLPAARLRISRLCRTIPPAYPARRPLFFFFILRRAATACLRLLWRIAKRYDSAVVRIS